MSHRSLLGLDLGTSALKAVLVRADGTVLGSATASYPIHQPAPGAAEQDPADWWRACVRAVRQVVTEADTANAAIAAIGVSGQMHGTVLLGSDATPLAPAIIWADQRGADDVAAVTERIGRERLLELTGTPAAAGFQAVTLSWLARTAPDLLRQTRTVVLPKDELRRRLTGVIATDPSDAGGTLLFDLRQQQWSREITAALDLDPTWLPPIRASWAEAGRLLPAPATELCLPAGIPVVTGAADTAAGLLGAGVIAPGRLMIAIGSGGQVAAPVSAPVIDCGGRSHTFSAALAGFHSQPQWYQMGATLAAGLAFRWLGEHVFGHTEADSFAWMTGQAATAPPGARGLIFLPYLHGERTPHMDPRARGLFLGLTERHGQAELARAAMEGIAFSCFDAFSVLADCGVAPRRIVLTGGGATSELWRQIFADLFGLPVVTPQTSEQSALGTAMLAAIGQTELDPAETAKTWVLYSPETVPDPARHRFYDRLFAIYRQAYADNAASFAALTALDADSPAESPPAG